MAISGALNHYAQEVARHVVEDICKGRLIYAGGDDVLALLAVDDVLPALMLLRATYSGDGDVCGLPLDLRGLRIGRDHVELGGRVLPTMGARATASAGAVVAHHTAPLAHVLRALDEAEQAAKHAGRNRFELRVMKRGGGEVKVNAGFWAPSTGNNPPPLLLNTAAGLLLRIAQALDASEFSRRAIYTSSEWLAALPARGTGGLGDDSWRDMVASTLRLQFARQSGLARHADEAVALACAETTAEPQHTARYLGALLLTAEFFGRQRRSSGSATDAA
jgi:CRISPR-associated protein Cmr2